MGRSGGYHWRSGGTVHCGGLQGVVVCEPTGEGCLLQLTQRPLAAQHGWDGRYAVRHPFPLLQRCLDTRGSLRRGGYQVSRGTRGVFFGLHTVQGQDLPRPKTRRRLFWVDVIVSASTPSAPLPGFRRRGLSLGGDYRVLPVVGSSCPAQVGVDVLRSETGPEVSVWVKGFPSAQGF